jgi:ElaA protein
LSRAVDGAGMQWDVQAFGALTPDRLYAVLAARAEVFVLEQACLYQDIDGLDREALHLLGMDAGVTLLAYARLLPPAPDTGAARIGRVLTTAAGRGRGLGRTLLARALDVIHVHWPGCAVELHAQAHLQDFYGAAGFAPSSAVHDEDGIAHVWMRRDAPSPASRSSFRNAFSAMPEGGLPSAP